MNLCVCQHPDKAHIEGKDACDMENCDCHKFRDTKAPPPPSKPENHFVYLESTRTEFIKIKCQHKEQHTFMVTIPRKEDEDFMEFFKKVEKIHAIVLTPDQCDLFRMGGTIRDQG